MTVEAFVGDSYLVNPYGDRYWFGEAAAPDVVLLGADEFGCVWWTPEPTGWNTPEASTPVDQRSYGDGGYTGPTTFPSRALAFGGDEPGQVVAPDRPAAVAAMRRLTAVCSSRTEQVYTQADGFGVWSIRLRATGRPKLRWLDPASFEFAFDMVAEDPFLFVAAEAATPRSTYLPVTQGGRTWPKVWPVTYGAGISEDYGTLQLVNDGDEPAPVTVTITGPVTQPTVTVAGYTFWITGLVGPLDRAVVDSRAGTVLLNGTPIYDRFYGDFPYLPPGAHVLSWAGPAADGRLTLPVDDSDATLTAYAASTRR